MRYYISFCVWRHSNFKLRAASVADISQTGWNQLRCWVTWRLIYIQSFLQYDCIFVNKNGGPSGFRNKTDVDSHRHQFAVRTKSKTSTHILANISRGNVQDCKSKIMFECTAQMRSLRYGAVYDVADDFGDNFIRAPTKRAVAFRVIQ